MDEGYKNVQQTSKTTNVLPDIVHAEQASVVKIASDGNRSNIKHQSEDENPEKQTDTVESRTETESISEHIAAKIDSISESEVQQSQSHKSPTSYSSSQHISNTEDPDSKNIEESQVTTERSEDQSQDASDNVQSGQPVQSIASPSIFEAHQESWNASDVRISEESPVVLASSDLSSRDVPKSKSLSPKPDDIQSPHSVYLDSLNEPQEDSQAHGSLENEDSLGKCSSGSEEIIKLDIRGQATPKFQYEAAKIIFGPPPENSTIIGPGIESIPIITNLLSPCMVTDESGHIQGVFEPPTKDVPDKSITPPSEGSSKIEQDVLVEEILVEDITREETERHEETPKSFLPEENISYSTLSTDYRTICEEYYGKLMHLEEAINERNTHIADLKVSLQKTLHERDSLQEENEHLTTEVQKLQHILGENHNSDHDTVKGQLSDFIKYHSMVKEDSTKFYSALLSGSTSLQSSNGEKDMDQAEITIDHSKSDIRTSTPEELESDLENKLITLLNTFDAGIEDNIRNKLKESLMQFMINENVHAKTESDAIKKLELQMKHEIHENMLKVSQLRELLSTVKAGSADVDKLRDELNIKHEEDMNNLRKYYEQKCADVAKNFSEDVDRRRSCASPDAGAGDARPFRSLSIESNLVPVELDAARLAQRYERQLEELRTEHVAFVADLQAAQRETVLALKEQITQLKAHIQTSENTEPNEYPQDIDLELEKDPRLRDRDERVRKQTLRELGRELQVLLSDPDAELSSWPLELVALRDKIHSAPAPADTREEKECSTIRSESPADGDRWRQRRNNSFDQNRQLEEITKERDELRAFALTLRRAVSQLVAYCATAEDELNRTVLHNLLRHFAPDDSTFDDSRPSSPGLDVSRRVHFAPRLDDILSSLDESAVAGYLRHQRDLGASIKAELELSLRRLRTEAHELLQLSDRLTTKPANDSKMIESSPVKITEMVDEYEKQKDCENCQYQKKYMEEAIEECLQREAALRAERDAAMLRLANLGDAPPSSPRGDVIEGYGVGAGEVGSAGGSRSLESARSPREQLAIAARDIDALAAERDDLRQQLEAASAQLRSTRQFVEEQTAEREQEHEEWAARLEQMREENASLAARLNTNARILAEVEQLEIQTHEMNQIIADLEARKTKSDEEAKASKEEIAYLRDIIGNLENKLEQKTSREAEVLQQLEEMKRTIDDRDSKIRAQLGELDSLRSERAEQTDTICPRCSEDEDKYNELLDKIKEEAGRVTRWVCRRRRRLERAHERVSPPTSDHTEDVSLPDRQPVPQSPEVGSGSSDEADEGAGGVLAEVWAALGGHARAADAALKRIADLEMQRAALKDMAQEVRAERDVLQARMSEQALRLSSLSARLQRQRADADALAHAASSALSVQLSDAQAEVQRLKEELESKDKQLTRLKQSAEERDRCHEKHQPLYGNLCNPKDKVAILEKALSDAQSRVAQLEEMAQALEAEKEALESTVREQQRALADREDQLNEIMALKLEEEEKEKSEIVEAKASARTLSDIVSISEYDEDLQMRRAEIKNHSTSFTHPDRLVLNKTLPPDAQPNMSSLHAEFVEHFDFKDVTPHADSLPAYLTSTQNREVYKRSVNEMTAIASAEKLIPDNCSIYPNRDISESKNISVEPKKINFSLEPSDNKTHDEEFPSLQELGITLDIKRENFPSILTQLKQEINKAKSEIQIYKSQLKNAEEQLCEFPALKKEVEELKTLLDNTVATMENDKKFYENQLESFSVNKKLLEQRIADLAREAGEKSKDLHLLKEDILRRENMILELAKEKRNLTSKIAELESRIEQLQSKNIIYEKYEIENKQMKEKISNLNKLEQLVSEKNQQIDSLNQHLDRLDDLQRRLNDKNEELDNVKEALEEKTNELLQIQESIGELNRDMAKVIEENDQLSDQNKDLKLQLSKIEKEQENVSLKLQKSDGEVERLSSLNNELSSRIDEMKQLNQNLKDKETEIEILHEDMDVYHNEIALLKEQLKMISRSPSPRTKVEEKLSDRQAANDKKQLVKIKKQISHLQHELDFNKKDLNDKAFELAKAKLDLTEMKANLSEATKTISEKDSQNIELIQQADSLQVEIKKLRAEKQQLSEQLAVVVARLREESNITELKEKLRAKTERCQELEVQLASERELMDSHRQMEIDRHRELVNRQTELGNRQTELERSRSPTAELEQAVRAQLDYSHALDHQIVEHILSATSDDRDDIPRLALNSSRSSSVHSSSSERYHRLRGENDKLELQVNNLECRLRDKDALIAELNRVRDQLSSDLQCAALRYEAERDNSARLMLLLESQKESSEAQHQQDSNVISLLQRRLETAMLHDERVPPLSPPRRAAADPRAEVEWSQLRSSVSVLRAQLDAERRRSGELRAQLDAARAHAERDGRARDAALAALRAELAELRRLKRESCVELANCRELLRARALHDRVDGSKTPRIEVESPELTRLKGRSAEDMDQAVRYLQARCLLLESWRKALVWQKRYLVRSLAGYQELEARELPAPAPATRTPLARFRTGAWCVVAALRLRFVAARRMRTRAYSTDALLRVQCSSPLTPLSRDVTRDVTSRLRRDTLTFSPALGYGTSGDMPRSPLAVSSPHREPFLLNPVRGESTRKLCVSRCLTRAMDAARDVP